MSLIYIVLLIGVLVFVHEFGHFVVAKLFRVKVLSFSIGFGPKIYGFQRGETEWVLRWLPLGGYVQMLGADPFDEVAPEDKGRAFNDQPLWVRSLVILAGPVANLLLPIPILFAVLLATHTEDLPPVVGQVLEGTPAEGKLEPGDEIVSIDGKAVRYWTTLLSEVSGAPGRELRLVVRRDGAEVEVGLTPRETLLQDELGIVSQRVGRIGITPDQMAPVIGIVDPEGPAARAQMATFDEVVMVGEQRVTTYLELWSALQAAGGAAVEVVLLRELPLGVPYGHVAVAVPRRVRVTAVYGDGMWDYGLESAGMYISQVDAGSPAALAGLQRGDRILALNGKGHNVFRSLVDEMAQGWEAPQVLTVRRDGQILEVPIALERLTVLGEFQEERPVIVAGFYSRVRTVPPPLRQLSWGDRFWHSSATSVETTVRASTMLVLYLYGMAEGRVSTKSIGGPIMIGHMASKAGEDGLASFLRMLAVISINLGIINLLPIPVLDGGHLLLFAIEGVKRGPLSMRTRQIASFIGFSMVVFLMLFAFKNDFERYWSLIFG